MQLTLFSPEIEKSLKWQTFLSTDLGKFYKSIPLDELVKHFPALSNKGVERLIGLRGGIALQFLKSYLDLSDARLIERLNTDWSLQLFCGVDFGLHTKIKDEDYVGRWRRWLAQYLDIDKVQQTLVQAWDNEISDQQCCLMDATCYESHLRYPTDAKLLWECCQWVFETMFAYCKQSKIRRPRSKYQEKKRDYQAYARRKKKSYKKTQKIKKKLLYLLEKGIGQLVNLLNNQKINKHLFGKKAQKRLGIIGQVLKQQKEIYKDGQTAGKDRIVSLSKPYLRPIVRGKETKRVEFGVKAHLFKVGGICLIEHLSFNAFNEGTRFKSTVRLQQKYLQKKVTMAGGDKIYGTRKNRKWCKDNGIATNFVPLGRPKKKTNKYAPSRVIRQSLNKERSTVLEGAFGNHKLHYGLGRVRAKTKETEILWIAFGVWTAAAVKIAKIKQQKSCLSTQVA